MHPDLSKIHRVADPRIWRDRVIIWLGAVVTGLCIVGFIWLTEAATHLFLQCRMRIYWIPLLVTPIGGILVVWLTRQYASNASGSGIPQVITALNEDLSPVTIRSLTSLRLSFAKAILAAGAIAAGFSTGREGPSVQIASGVMLSFHQWVGNKNSIKARDLILAGGAAGIAAAFNAPLAGVVFAIEELGKRFEERSSGLVITSIVIAGLVAISLMGNLTYFGRLQVDSVPLRLFWPALLVSVAAGLIGGMFSRVLINSFSKTEWPINRWRSQNPIIFAGACGLVVAILGLMSEGAAFGSGYAWSRQILSGQSDIATHYFVIKFIATWISFWSGIPGGIFAPALAIGAGIGHDVALFTGSIPAPIIALGMAGFLAAVTQTPITSFIIIMEMTDGHTVVLSLMAAVLFSTMISRLISAPLYQSLALLQLKHIAPITTHSHEN
jgi:H+/Cl- antiporter ClcA